MPSFDPARTGFNPYEDRVNVANIGSLHEAWRAPSNTLASPVVADGRVYTADAFTVQAFDARGITGCSGSPRVCAPQWSATTADSPRSLAVVNGTIYVGTNEEVQAFDAGGVRGCSGTPPTCSPLWSASGIDPTSFVVADGFVYAAAADSDATLYAFDAAGVNGCSGTPKVCAPLWSAEGGRPSVANGILYASGFVGDVFEVHAFDAKGVQGCSGTPKVCTPLWTGRENFLSNIMVDVTAPVIAHGLVFVGIHSGDEMGVEGKLVGFDAAGVQGCSNTPKTCAAIWRAPTDGVFNAPAVAGDRLYVTDFFFGEVSGTRRNTLRAFDIDACSTSRPPCAPLWTAPQVWLDGPVVANGVVYAKDMGFRIAPFDGAGNVNCSGLPRVCTPLTSSIDATEPTAPAITNGAVYVATSEGLRTYELR